MDDEVNKITHYLYKLKALDEFATPPPWFWNYAFHAESSHVIVADTSIGLADRSENQCLWNAYFITVARTLFPRFLDIAFKALEQDPNEELIKAMLNICDEIDKLNKISLDQADGRDW